MADPHGVTAAPTQGQRARSPVGGEVEFLVRGEQSDGALAALDVGVPPGEGPPLHVHGREDETAYVLEGEFRWKLGDEIRPTPPGSFVYIPRGLAHCFQNIGDESGRLLITFFPSGMEHFFDLMAAAPDLSLEQFKRAAAECAMDVVGPPLAQSDPV
jgi:quercetin dioxygenase-like cupin family protein